MTLKSDQLELGFSIYENDLFNILQISCVGCHIGKMYCGAPGCADDVALLAKTKIR